MNYKSVTDIADIVDYIGGSTVVAFDFETAPNKEYIAEPKAALDSHKSHIVGMSISISEATGIYIPLAHKAGDNADVNAVFAYLKTSLFENPKVTKVAHNLAFEAMFLYAQNIIIQPPCYDTIAAAQLTLKGKYEFRTLKDCGLKTLVPELYGISLPSFESVTAGRAFDELTPTDPETVRYACADSDFALRLYHTFNEWFDRYLPKHRFITEEIESPTAVFVGLMKYNGVPVDKATMLKKQEEAEQKIAEPRSQIALIIGNVNIGANASTSAFKRYLFDELKLPVLKTTAKYQEASDDETLILLREWCGENRPELVCLFDLVQEYRKWGKLKSTYIDGYMTHINIATGRIHPDFMPLGTETGRFACRAPNLQNCPRKGNDPVGIRKIIAAPAGKLLVSVDLSQIELRVGAFYCRDAKMLETYRNGGDIHAQTTSVIYGISFEAAQDKASDGYKERRSIAKNCNFGVFYGLFPQGLQHTLRFKAGLDTPISECERIISSLKNGYPGLTRWQNEVKRRATTLRYSETWQGRRRYLTGISSSDWGKRSFAERCAMNTPIQGTAADILKLSMVRILLGIRERPWLMPFLQIHDELVFEIPESRKDEATAFIKLCMEAQPFPEFDVPILAEAATGRSFGELD